MEPSIFEGFKIVKERKYRDAFNNEVRFSTQERNIDENKKQILYVNRMDEYYEVVLSYQAKENEIPGFVFRICGDYDYIIDEFRAKMYELHGNGEYAESIRTNPTLH